jgi:hypothetical protein
MERYDSPEPMNLGSGREITIRDLTQLVGQLSRFEGEIVWDATKPDGQPRRCLDVSRAFNARLPGAHQPGRRTAQDGRVVRELARRGAGRRIAGDSLRRGMKFQI